MCFFEGSGLRFPNFYTHVDPSNIAILDFMGCTKLVHGLRTIHYFGCTPKYPQNQTVCIHQSAERPEILRFDVVVCHSN